MKLFLSIFSRAILRVILLTLWLSPFALQAQTFSVSGRVVDDKNEPLNGVSINLKGSVTGTTTDNNGRFSLTVPDANTTLVFSYVGFLAQEFPIKQRSQIEVKLVKGVSELNEVVVVGYGTQKKTSLTTAVASLSGKELTDQSPAGDLRKALQGMTPGLAILDNGGQPGNNKIQMQIRGISSVTVASLWYSLTDRCNL